MQLIWYLPYLDAWSSGSVSGLMGTWTFLKLAWGGRIKTLQLTILSRMGGDHDASYPDIEKSVIKWIKKIKSENVWKDCISRQQQKAICPILFLRRWWRQWFETAFFEGFENVKQFQLVEKRYNGREVICLREVGLWLILRWNTVKQAVSG